MSRKPNKVSKPAARRRRAKTPVRAKTSVRAKTPIRAKGHTQSAGSIDALVTASAQALKLPIDPAWHAGVKFNLDLILRIAALVDEFPLPDDAEPGPVFHA